MAFSQDPSSDLLLQRDCAAPPEEYSSSSSTSVSIDGGDDRSNLSSGVSTPTGGTPPPPSPTLRLLKNRGGQREPSGGLMVPTDQRTAAGEISRTPSPMGLIPIHKSWGKLIHKHEVPRKLLHVSMGGLATYLYTHGYQPRNLTPWLSLALVPIATADYLRLNHPSFNRFYIRVLGALMRESEVRGTNGVVWYLVGSLTVLLVFPKDIATLSVLLLSWCDTAASTVGRAWGRYTPRVRKGKSLAGCVAGFVVGAVTAAWFLGWIVPSTPRFQDDPVEGLMWKGRLGFDSGRGSGEDTGWGWIEGGWALGLMSLCTGLVASASEAMDLWGFDDNVVIPVVSAVGVWGILKIFG
ncbi:putative phosphatidate cytidylyltransferase [Tirmania nivea]|nr:putative phosphatidate cytidylyltransferase [Tirmania nivea]